MKGFCVLAAALCMAAVGGAQSAPDVLTQLIRQNDLAGLKARLSGGTDVDSRDARGNTLLMQAAAFGSVDAVKLLLNSGADVKAKNQFETTALILGAGNPEMARLLVEKGSDVNARNKTGHTALLVAALCSGCSGTVKLLLDKGADPKAEAEHKSGPMENGVLEVETVKLLLERGTPANHADEGGNTPLQWAASNCSLENVKLLLAKGADVNVANTFSGEVKFGKIQLIGLTPLALGATYCSTDVVKALLDARPNVNARDIRGMSPLMFAVSSEEQNPAVVRLLIKAGANVNAKCNTDETALDWANRFHNPQVLAALKEAGAKEGVPYTPPVHKPGGTVPVRQAVEKATALLQTGATEFFKQSGCVGCHHQPAALTAVSAARAAGVKVREDEAASYIKMMEGQTMHFQQAMLDRSDIGGAMDGGIATLLSLAGEHYGPRALTDVLVTYIASYQRPDGSWWFGGIARSPMEEGFLARTAGSMRTLQLYGTPALKAEFDARIARARDFMRKAKARTTDDAAMQVAGLYWGGGSEGQVQSLAKALIAAQHSDGGWASNPNLGSDAYATGEALWSLKEAGVLKPTDPVYQKGVKYLLGTQWEDGSWHVRSRAAKFQPYFQSGFPFDHDQWISSAATSWAVRALAPAIDNERRASR